MSCLFGAVHCSYNVHYTHKHDDVIKWKHFPRHWPFVRGIHRSPVNSPHKGQWRGVLMFSLICAWINGWVNKGKAGDLRRHRTHCDVTVMVLCTIICTLQSHHLGFPVVNPSSQYAAINCVKFSGAIKLYCLLYQQRGNVISKLFSYRKIF